MPGLAKERMKMERSRTCVSGFALLLATGLLTIGCQGSGSSARHDAAVADGPSGTPGADVGKDLSSSPDAAKDSPTDASCVPESDTAFCARLAKTCGSVTANDNCKQSRTVDSCGTCATSLSCSSTNTCTWSIAAGAWSGTSVEFNVVPGGTSIGKTGSTISYGGSMSVSVSFGSIGTCSSASTTKVLTSTISISNNSFSYASSDLTVSGTFSSATQASGSYELKSSFSSCGVSSATASGKWTATWKSAPVISDAGTDVPRADAADARADAADARADLPGADTADAGADLPGRDTVDARPDLPGADTADAPADVPAMDTGLDVGEDAQSSPIDTVLDLMLDSGAGLDGI
jgi:hypothetical protein